MDQRQQQQQQQQQQPQQMLPPTSSQVGTQSSPTLPQQRRFDESWVELSSQPSSSSLSSIGDDIVVTGLEVTGPYARRRRLRAPIRPTPPHHLRQQAMGASSQEEEEEEESESDEDHVMTSSAENIHSSAKEDSEGSDQESDDGDNATALGKVSDTPVFRPQPNAFSHPPLDAGARRHSTNSSVPSHPHHEFRRPSFSQRSQTRIHRSGPSFMSPSLREDNDAALRASLSTLLSCAAAARGLPKTEQEAASRRAARTGVTPSDEPLGLRLVQEKELIQPSKSTNTAGSPNRHSSPGRSSSTSPSLPAKSKRAPAVNKNARTTKKSQTTSLADDGTGTLISPTMLTWVVSAGVVVLVSVVGFGAGYVIGREVGRQEAQDVLTAGIGGSMNDTTTCGQEVMRSSGSGLRKLRWGGVVGKSITAQA